MKPEGNLSQRKGSNYSDVLHTYDDLNPIPVCSAVLGCLVITRDLLSSVASKWLSVQYCQSVIDLPSGHFAARHWTIAGLLVSYVMGEIDIFALSALSCYYCDH